MSDLLFSTCSLTERAILDRIIAPFERNSYSSVNSTIIDWAEAWKEFLQISLYRRGAHVSEVGSTWMKSLTSRNSLRAFHSQELHRIGRIDDFPSELWMGCYDHVTKEATGIPWVMDTYLLFYHSSMLKEAGIEEETAFSSVDQFLKTIQRLKEKGVAVPFALPTHSGSSTVCSFIWDAGGDFFSDDGSHLALTHPATLAGMENYFQIFKTFPTSMKSLTADESISMFLNQETAMLLYDPAPIRHREQLDPAGTLDVKVTTQPGVPLIGGSDFVIWNHIPPMLEQRAVDLIAYLTSRDAQLLTYDLTGLLPANLPALKKICNTPDYAPVIKSMETGRTMGNFRLWGMIEEKIASEFDTICIEILEEPDQKLAPIIKDHMTRLENRINLSLS